MTATATATPIHRSAVSVGTALTTGAAGWRLMANKNARSGALLNKLVPTVLVLSLIPDVALLVTDSMAGQTTAGVLSLMVMHVLTAVIVVTAYRRAMPTTWRPVRPSIDVQRLFRSPS
jgi:hypothetical protein